MCKASKNNRNTYKMRFIINIQREKESRITSRSRSEDISLGRHALTSKPRLTPRLGLCQSMSPSTDIFRSGTRGHPWFSYSKIGYFHLRLFYFQNAMGEQPKHPRFIQLRESGSQYGGHRSSWRTPEGHRITTCKCKTTVGKLHLHCRCFFGMQNFIQEGTTVMVHGIY